MKIIFGKLDLGSNSFFHIWTMNVTHKRHLTTVQLNSCSGCGAIFGVFDKSNYIDTDTRRMKRNQKRNMIDVIWYDEQVFRRNDIVFCVAEPDNRDVLCSSVHSLMHIFKCTSLEQPRGYECYFIRIEKIEIWWVDVSEDIRGAGDHKKIDEINDKIIFFYALGYAMKLIGFPFLNPYEEWIVIIVAVGI